MPFSLSAMHMFIVLEVEKDLSELVDLTMKEVVDWFPLGVLLGVDFASLDRIKLEHASPKEWLIRMLREWLLTGHATWANMILALCKVGHVLLARRIAAKIGTLQFPCLKCVCVCICLCK